MIAEARQRALAYLGATRNRDGSWPFVPGDPGAPEPTVLAGAAGAGAAVEYLGSADLGYAGLLLPAALAEVPGTERLREAAVQQILSLQAKVSENQDREINAIDTSIPAWGWVPETSAWVEPTAYAVLSLARAGLGEHERAVQGRAMLRDRQCADGGWNYGNTRVYGAELDSEIAPTGWAVMALPPGPDAARGLERLLDALQHPSTLALSLAILGRAAHEASFEGLPERLVSRQREDGSFASRCDWTALAACALRVAEGGGHVFVVR